MCHSMGTDRCKPREEARLPNHARCSQLKAGTSSLGALALFTCRGVTTNLDHNGFLTAVAVLLEGRLTIRRATD